MVKSFKKPPIAGQWILKKVLPQEERNFLLGDIEETYAEKINENGLLTAVIWYWFQFIKTVPPVLIDQIFWRSTMFKNYLKIALRNIKKSKSYTFINVFGFAVGLATCLLILLHVKYELSYDKFFEKGDNIYRLMLERKYPEKKSRHWGWTSVIDGATMKEEFPEIVDAARLLTEVGAETQVDYLDKKFIETRAYYADPNFFNIFAIPFVHGDPKTALEEPYTAVITKATAEKYFGESDPIGKKLYMRNWWANHDGNFRNEPAPYTITAVCEPVPANSHVHFDFLLSIKGTRVDQSENRGYWQVFNYLLLDENVDPEALEAKFPEYIKRHYGKLLEEQNINFDEYFAAGNSYIYTLEPLKDIHLKSIAEHQVEPVSSIRYIYIFSVTAVIILLIACINFMNLSTARSSSRAREVGVRKTIG
ncbi:ABC transporter permease, partial [candidate division KSB1 bacterium]